jgi:hypothetical protein
MIGTAKQEQDSKEEHTSSHILDKHSDIKRERERERQRLIHLQDSSKIIKDRDITYPS